MAELYTNDNPHPDHYGILGPILKTSNVPDAEILHSKMTRLIPQVLPQCGGLLEYAGLEDALFGNQLKRPLELKDIPLALAYAGAISNAVTTLRRASVIKYTRAFPLMYLRLARRHE
jgi:hypothetical protein